MDEDTHDRIGREMRESAETGKQHALKAFFWARRMRMQLIETMDAFHRRFDLPVTSTASCLACPTGHDVPPETDNYQFFPQPLNATGQPGVSVPCGFTRAGLAFGLQIVGRRREDALVLRAGRTFEAANLLHDRHPPLG